MTPSRRSMFRPFAVGSLSLLVAVASSAHNDVAAAQRNGATHRVAVTQRAAATVPHLRIAPALPPMTTPASERRWKLLTTAIKGGVLAVLASLLIAIVYHVTSGYHGYDGIAWIYVIVVVASPVVFIVGAGAALLLRALR